MTYVNKKTRVFLDRGDFKPERRRSEARLKTYPSAVDLRAWSDDVEDRRQHILELVQKGVDKCLPNLIPIDALVDTLVSEKNEEINKLKNQLGEQGTSRITRVKSIETHPKSSDQPTSSNKASLGKCHAEKRHEKEKAEVEKIIDMPNSYKVRSTGPVKITTKLKGLKPGFQISPGAGNIATKATIRNVHPANNVETPKEKVASESNDGAAPSTARSFPLNEAPTKKPEGLNNNQDVTPIRPINDTGTSDKRPTSPSNKIATPVRTKDDAGTSVKKSGSPNNKLAASVRSKDDTGNFDKKPAIQNEKVDTPVRPQDNKVTYFSPEVLKTSKGEENPATLEQPLVATKTEPQSRLIPESDVPRKQQEMENKILELQDELAARDALCNEQQASIKYLQAEKDSLNKRMQDCLRELEKLKKMDDFGNPVIPKPCKEEIEALEHEMQLMRSGNPSPEQEAEFIKKEIDILKRYCLKLKTTEDENEKLKLERDQLRSQMNVAELNQNIPEKEFVDVEAILKERDALANKVQKLEKELLQYQDLPEDMDVYKDRSKMLDNALEERDNLRKQLEEMQKTVKDTEELRRKSRRVDELENMLSRINKNGRTSDYELQKTISKCCCLEKDLKNYKQERDAMCKRIEYMQIELDQLRSRAKESEMLKLERDRLQIKLNELSHVEAENESMAIMCKCLERSAMERDTYKQKYTDILSMECQCEVLRTEAEEAHNIAREKEHLMKQVGDLEVCIHEQEEEIKKLLCQIDCLTRTKDETQVRMKEALCNMRNEVEKKDSIIAASEEKLVAVQAQLKSSIQGVSCETTCYKTRIDELERQFNNAQVEIKRLQKQLKERDGFMKGAKTMNNCEMEAVSIMRKELDVARAENKKLQEIANKMRSITGDEHVQRMLRQSECAVRRVVEELSKQYRDWDSMRRTNQKGKFSSKTCPCNVKHFDSASDSENDNDKLKEELEDIQKEKDKLENLVKQIQKDKYAEGPQKELLALRMENSKLQENLRKETDARKSLERKLIK